MNRKPIDNSPSNKVRDSCQECVSVHTWQYRHRVPRKTSACVLSRCTRCQRRQRSKQCPCFPCKKGYCDIGGLCSHTPTEVSVEMSGLSCQPWFLVKIIDRSYAFRRVSTSHFYRHKNISTVRMRSVIFSRRLLPGTCFVINYLPNTHISVIPCWAEV